MAKPHYVDNKKLFQVLCDYKDALNRGESPAIPEYVGECLLRIATRLSNKPNFASYTYRDDMISDAIENSILYLYNFNPEKSRNPFAYFTQIIHYAFLRRIEKEKKNMYIKYKYALRMAQTGEDHASFRGESYDMKEPTWAGYENVHEFIYAYEQKLNKKRASKVDDLEEIVDDDDTFDSLNEEATDNEYEEVDEFDDTEDDE